MTDKTLNGNICICIQLYRNMREICERTLIVRKNSVGSLIMLSAAQMVEICPCQCLRTEGLQLYTIHVLKCRRSV